MRRKNIMAAIRHRRNLIAMALRLRFLAGKKQPSKKLYRRPRGKISDAEMRE
jgi:hypothetical protein